MQSISVWAVMAGLVVGTAGCVHREGADASPAPGSDGVTVSPGRAVSEPAAGAGVAGPFEQMQQAVARAAASIDGSVALVKLRGVQGGAKKRIAIVGGRMRQTGGGTGTKTMTGIVVGDGYALIPGNYKPDSAERVEVWLGDTEHAGRIVKGDDQLGMTMVKFEADEGVRPLDLASPADLETGDWCVMMEPSDESREFARFTLLAMCRGVVDGRYRQFALDRMSRGAVGGPVVDMAGRLVGVAQGGGVIAMSDMLPDLQAFIDEAAGVTSPDEEAKQKGWFGAMLEPVNLDYAKAKGMPKSALWVMRALRDGPAAAAGVADGDLIVAANGKPLRLSGGRARDYFLKTLRPKVDAPFTVTVIRDGQRLECAGTFTRRPEPKTLRAEDIGVTVKEITDGDYFSANLFTTDGVLVTDVHQGSPAATSGSFRHALMRKNDVITSMAGRPVRNLDEFTQALDAVRRENPDVALVTFYRGRTTGYSGLNLKIGENGKGGAE